MTGRDVAGRVEMLEMLEAPTSTLFPIDDSDVRFVLYFIVFLDIRLSVREADRRSRMGTHVGGSNTPTSPTFAARSDWLTRHQP